jgi:excinuclease UvrABC ATPase subunit
VVDRIKVSDARTRITDSVETAYSEGGGAAWASAADDSGQRPIQHLFSERFECRHLRHSIRGSAAALVLVQQPVRRLPDCHGFGNIIELDQELVVP